MGGRKGSAALDPQMTNSRRETDGLGGRARVVVPAQQLGRTFQAAFLPRADVPGSDFRLPADQGNVIDRLVNAEKRHRPGRSGEPVLCLRQ